MYQQLCSDVDTIIHNGALVNHAYSYEQLFEPNVLGTVEVSTSAFCAVLLAAKLWFSATLSLAML